nr:transmembrane protein 273 isoform X1 [Kogia breviceps]
MVWSLTMDDGAAQVLATGQPAEAKIVAAATSPGQQDLPGFRGLAGVPLHTHGPVLSPPQGSAHQAQCHLHVTSPGKALGSQLARPSHLAFGQHRAKEENSKVRSLPTCDWYFPSCFIHAAPSPDILAPFSSLKLFLGS